MLAQLQRDVAQALGDPGHFETPSQGKECLRGLPAQRAALLVLDDIWEGAHAEAFDALGPRCRMLAPARNCTACGAINTMSSAWPSHPTAGASDDVDRHVQAHMRHIMQSYVDCC